MLPLHDVADTMEFEKMCNRIAEHVVSVNICSQIIAGFSITQI